MTCAPATAPLATPTLMTPSEGQLLRPASTEPCKPAHAITAKQQPQPEGVQTPPPSCAMADPAGSSKMLGTLAVADVGVVALRTLPTDAQAPARTAESAAAEGASSARGIPVLASGSVATPPVPPSPSSPAGSAAAGSALAMSTASALSIPPPSSPGGSMAAGSDMRSSHASSTSAHSGADTTPPPAPASLAAPATLPPRLLSPSLLSPRPSADGAVHELSFPADGGGDPMGSSSVAVALLASARDYAPRPPSPPRARPPVPAQPQPASARTPNGVELARMAAELAVSPAEPLAVLRPTPFSFAATDTVGDRRPPSHYRQQQVHLKGDPTMSPAVALYSALSPVPRLPGDSTAWVLTGQRCSPLAPLQDVATAAFADGASQVPRPTDALFRFNGPPPPGMSAPAATGTTSAFRRAVFPPIIDPGSTPGNVGSACDNCSLLRMSHRAPPLSEDAMTTAVDAGRARSAACALQYGTSECTLTSVLPKLALPPMQAIVTPQDDHDVNTVTANAKASGAAPLVSGASLPPVASVSTVPPAATATVQTESQEAMSDAVARISPALAEAVSVESPPAGCHNIVSAVPDAASSPRTGSLGGCSGSETLPTVPLLAGTIFVPSPPEINRIGGPNPSGVVDSGKTAESTFARSDAGHGDAQAVLTTSSTAASSSIGSRHGGGQNAGTTDEGTVLGPASVPSIVDGAVTQPVPLLFPESPVIARSLLTSPRLFPRGDPNPADAEAMALLGEASPSPIAGSEPIFAPTSSSSLARASLTVATERVAAVSPSTPPAPASDVVRQSLEALAAVLSPTAVSITDRNSHPQSVPAQLRFSLALTAAAMGRAVSVPAAVDSATLRQERQRPAAATVPVLSTTVDVPADAATRLEHPLLPPLGSPSTPSTHTSEAHPNRAPSPPVSLPQLPGGCTGSKAVAQPRTAMSTPKAPAMPVERRVVPGSSQARSAFTSPLSPIHSASTPSLPPRRGGGTSKNLTSKTSLQICRARSPPPSVKHPQFHRALALAAAAYHSGIPPSHRAGVGTSSPRLPPLTRVPESNARPNGPSGAVSEPPCARVMLPASLAISESSARRRVDSPLVRTETRAFPVDALPSLSEHAVVSLADSTSALSRPANGGYLRTPLLSDASASLRALEIHRAH